MDGNTYIEASHPTTALSWMFDGVQFCNGSFAMCPGSTCTVAFTPLFLSNLDEFIPIGTNKDEALGIYLQVLLKSV